MDIDWSKAPEDATHARTHNTGIDFYKRKDCGQWSYWRLNSQWVRAFSTSETDCVERPAPWTGEGMPPVGTTCERRFHDVEGSSWMGCIILAHGSKRIFYRDNCGDEFAHSLDEVQFRAFRTAEQIAAEERNSAIDDMVSTALHQSYVITPAQAKIVLERIYDAGYRKQEQK